MDDYLRRLERLLATDPQEIHQLVRSRVRSGRCAAHGDHGCQDQNCQLIMGVYHALQTHDFIEKYNQINQILTQYSEVLLIEQGMDPHVWIPSEVYIELGDIFYGPDSLYTLFSICGRSIFANDVINYYNLEEAPYVGDRALHLLVRETLPNDRGWMNLVYTLFSDEDTYGGFRALFARLQKEIFKRISKQHPTLAIEKVLNGLPGSHPSTAADLIEKARVSLYLGEQWEAMGEPSPDGDVDDWHWISCEAAQQPDRSDDLLSRSNLDYQRWDSIAQWKAMNTGLDYIAEDHVFVYGHPFVYGYPNLIRVEIFNPPDGDLMIISQQLDQNIVEIKMDTRQRYSVLAAPAIHKMRQQDLSIIVNDSPPAKEDFEYYDFIQEEF